MKLPNPPTHYNAQYQQNVNHLLEQNDLQTQKRAQDIEVHPARIILRSPNGSRYEVRVSDGGVLSTTVVP